MMEALQRGFASAIEQFAVWGPRVLLGLVLLVVGWLVAKLLQKLASNLAQWVGIDRPFFPSDGEGKGAAMPAALMPSKVFGIVVFWLVLLFAAVTFLTLVNLRAVALPFQTILVRIGEWLPNLLAAALLTIIGWLLASLVRAGAMRLLKRLSADQRLGGFGMISQEAATQMQFTNFVATVLYAIVLVLFLLPALDVLGLSLIAETAQGTLQVITNAIPGILAAFVVMAVAALIAFVLRPPVTRLLAATGVDGWGKHVGLDPARGEGAATISSVTGHAVFWLILLFAFPAALDRLGLEPIVSPLRDAWAAVVGVIPRLALAIVIALAAVIVARIVGPLIERALRAVGFDAILGRVGLSRVEEASKSAGERWLPSRIVSSVAVLVIYLLMGQEALRALGFVYMADLVNRIVLYLPNIVVAVTILALSLFVAKIVSNLTRQATANVEGVSSGVAAGAAYGATVVFGAAMAIDQLSIGGDLVQWTVLLLVGALCLAGAIAVGLGVRPVIEDWARARWKVKSQ